MTKFAILPTQEDQSLFAQGRRPENIMMFDGYATEAEMQSFRDGMEAVANQADYEIFEERDLEIFLDIHGETTPLRFVDEASKRAFIAGLETGDGYTGPEIHVEGTPEYEAIAAFEAQVPAPPAMSTHGA